MTKAACSCKGKFSKFLVDVRKWRVSKSHRIYNTLMDRDDIYYKAMLSKDYRFDGKFYVAVKTTGIYCRPICPAKPKRENIEFFTDAYSAEKAGYRPCLRCHPEFSPDSMTWPGKSPVVQRALQLISQNGMIECDVEAFAQQFHISSRHLRRLFETEVGLSPKQISDLHRLNFAHKLICETQLELTQVALTSGFSSLRRFNDAFKKRYHNPPRLIRKSQSKSSENVFTLPIAYRPPLDWKSLLLYYSKHQIPFIEEVSEVSYQRVFKESGSMGLFHVENNEKKAQLELKVYCQDPKVLFPIVNRVRKMFDLNSDPLLISNQFSHFPFLMQLGEEFPGLRIARGWDAFEVAVGTILGQVISIRQASKLMGDLVQNYGEKIPHPLTHEQTFLFPTPEILEEASLDEIKTTTARKNAIRALCHALLNKKISFSESQDPKNFKSQLRAIKGIGNWSAEYISLRGLGDTNAFPKDDLILKRALQLNAHHFDLTQIEPWQGYLAVYLWKKYADTLSKARKKT
jgi:AraC family transcriptional regulator of adaptative response / DNA-3-methyladenine glycosylase II